MELVKWLRIYNRIVGDFGFSKEEDEESARLLARVLPEESAEHALSSLKKLLNGKTVFVIGASDEAVKQLRALRLGKMRYSEKFADSPKLSADGATSAIFEAGLVPDAVITDLDGDVDVQLKALEKGAIVVIHAHGDNMDKIEEYVPEFVRKGYDRVAGTTQGKPVGSVRDFGGFTDGDRAVHLACALGAKKVVLVGFDFTKVGKYSYLGSAKPTGGKAPFKEWKKKKLKKLSWARKLIFDYLPDGCSVDDISAHASAEVSRKERPTQARK